MSKSVGNIFQLSEALDRYGREAVVAYLISGHYRQPLEFSERGARARRRPASSGSATSCSSRPSRRRRAGPVRRRAGARRSSTRSPTTSTRRGRWAALFELIAEGNRRPLPGARAALAELLPLLGLESLLEPPAEAADPEAERLLAEREAARAERDFERADRIRDRARRARAGRSATRPEGARLRAAG